MRDIDADIKAQLESSELKIFALVHFDIDGTNYYYTDCDAVLAYEGNAYLPKSMDMGNIRISTSVIVDSFSIGVEDQDKELFNRVKVETGQKRKLKVSMIALGPDSRILRGDDEIAVEPFTLFLGEIDSWDFSNGTLKMEIVSLFSRWVNSTLSLHPTSCRWKIFGGTECKYSPLPSETCSRTYDECANFNNTANFGGFRWCASLLNKKIWWGSNPR